MKSTQVSIILVEVLALLPLLLLAQDNNKEPERNTFVAELNAKCPIAFNDGWQVNSFNTDADTVSVVITVAANVETYLPYMAANADQVKQMWLQKMHQYGPMWNTLIDLAISKNHSVVITLKAPSSEAQAQFTFLPSDFVKQQ